MSESRPIGRPNQHPRHINSTPSLVTSRLEQEVLNWYEGGDSYQKIQERVYFTHRKELAIEELCRITDQVLPRLMAWRKRSLQSVYACVWVSQVETELWQDNDLIGLFIYTVIGVDLVGRRDILGYYLCKPGFVEFWSDLVVDLKSRGVNDLLMVCVDQPALIEEATRLVYPLTQIHGCISQQMRRSLQQVNSKEKALVRKSLKAVYQATTSEQAYHQWQQVKDGWQSRYPLIVENWERNWVPLMSPMQYPKLVRQLTQGIPLLTDCYASIRHATQIMNDQTTQAECQKALFVVSRYKLSTQQTRLGGWGLLIQELADLFGQRVKEPLRI